MSAEVADVLRDALALIEDERNWCNDEEGGAKYDQDSGQQTSWCSVRAISAVGDFGTSLTACDALKRALGVTSVSAWNDSPERTHAEVVAAFKDAIVAEEWSE